MDWRFLAWGSRMGLNWALFLARVSTAPINSTKGPVIPPSRKASKLDPSPKEAEFLQSHRPEGGGAEGLPGDPAALSRSRAEPC